MTFSENLARLRDLNNLKQEEVADQIGVTARCYRNYEKGVREPQMSVLIALADLFDISLDELVCRER